MRHCLFIFTIFFLTLIFTTIIPAKTFAGNPLYMAAENTPLIWDTTETIKYKVDPDGLGKLSFSQSLALIQKAMKVWEAVSGTGIQFEYLGTVDEDITEDNWVNIAANHIHAEGNGNTSSITTDSQKSHYIVIGFDNTGDIFEAKGNSGATGIQSITGVKGTYDNPEHIISAHLFLNGLYYDGDEDVPDVSLIDFLSIIVHELGHSLGLDHALFHYQLYKDILSGDLDSSYARYLPTMFPRFIRGTGEHLVSLHPDDIATLQWMYGSQDDIAISGNVLDSNDDPVDTLIVTVRNSESPLCEVYSQATSITCDQMNSSSDGTGNNYFNGKYCMDDDALGAYMIPTLHNGDYTIDVQEIPALFESSIAKFDSVINEIPGGAELYNNHDSISDDAFSYSLQTISNNALEDIDIILSSSKTSENDLERIDYSYFEENDAFIQTTDDDSYCPLNASLSNDELLVLIDVNATEAINTSPDSSNNGGLTTTSGCNLKTTTVTQQKNTTNLLGYLCLLLLALIRQEKIKPSKMKP